MNILIFGVIMLKTKDILDEKEKILHEKALEATFPLEKEDIKLINDAYEYLRLSQDEEKAEKKATKKSSKKEEAPMIQNQAASTTLGDIDALAALKEQLEGKK